MVEYSWGDPTKEALDYLAANLKDEDRREIMGCTGRDIRGELERCVKQSEWAKMCFFAGRPCALFGIVRISPLDNSEGLVFLLTTAETLKYPTFTGRETKKALRNFCRHWDMLFNYCDAGNTLVLCWLKFLGAKIYPPAPYGLFGRPYHRFEFTAAGLAKRYTKDRKKG